MKEAHEDWFSSLKKTKSRQSVLSVLEQADKPLSAIEICSRMDKNGGSAWISTVYRILELFVKKGVALKVTMMNNETSLYELNRFEHKHYAVCLGCRKIVSMDNCPMERFIPKIKDEDFRVLGHNLEIYGYCKECSVR